MSWFNENQQLLSIERNEHLRIFRGWIERWVVDDGDDDDDETVTAAVTRIMMNKVKHFGVDVDVVILTRFMLCDNRIVTELKIVCTALWYNSVKLQLFEKKTIIVCKSAYVCACE